MSEGTNHKVAVRFTNVYFSYGDIEVLNNVSFHIHENEFVTIVGPNGTGKTTILKLILGLFTPQKGKVEVLGREPGYSLTDIGYIPQNVETDSKFPITVEEVIRMGLINGFKKNKNFLLDIDKVLDILDIKDLRKRQFSSLSGGQKRRVLAARALVSNPAVLILDEPVANMDIDSEKRLFDVLGSLKGKTTILIVTHDTTYVSDLTDVVLCMSKTREKEHCPVRHAFEPAGDISSDLYGSKVLRVLHNTDLPDDINCSKC